MRENLKHSYTPDDPGLEACLLAGCRAFDAGCRFAVFEPEQPARQTLNAASPAELAENQAAFAASPLVLATYEAEPDAGDHPLAGQAAYLRRGSNLGLAAGTRRARAPHSGEDSSPGRGDALLSALAMAAENSGWTRFLAEKTAGVIRRHEAFSVALAGCANACSNPHIADLGLIAVWRPELEPARCAGATACARDSAPPPCAGACPEEAVKMLSRKPAIDRKNCLDCGRCAKACPALALSSGPRGWRVFVGGRLGRHPRLAAPLPGLFKTPDLPAVLTACLDLHMKHYRPGTRFSHTAAAHKSRLLQSLAALNHL